MRAELAERGAVAVPDLLDAGWCDRLHRAIDRCRRTPSAHYGVLSPPGAPQVDSDLFRWTDDPDLLQLTHDSPVVELACALLDEDRVVLIEDQWFSSEPGAATPSPWHQDQPYYRVDQPFLTLWVTLDDIGDAGSLRVVPGSHLGPTFAPVEFVASAPGASSPTLPPPPDIDEQVAGAVRTWSLRARRCDRPRLPHAPRHRTDRARRSVPPHLDPVGGAVHPLRRPSGGHRSVLGSRSARSSRRRSAVVSGVPTRRRTHRIMSSQTGNSRDPTGSRSSLNVDVIKLVWRAARAAARRA